MPNQPYVSLVSIQTNQKDKQHMNTPLLERHLAVLQIKHYLSLHHSAVAVGDKVEAQRTTGIIDKLTAEYGVSALYEAQETQDE